MERTYIAIDLKSFYASVECVDRELDPLAANLVVADETRTEKTICLAVTPSLKAYGIPGRPRLFEVLQKVEEINRERKRLAPGHVLYGVSCDGPSLRRDPGLELGFIIAPPRMARYIEVSTQIYGIYTQFIAPEDIHVYSIDEVFIDVTPYLGVFRMTPRELAMKLIREVLKKTGITATAGIGTNLYLAKIAMDIVAKKLPADRDGVRIAELNEMQYRQKLWEHRPLTDFWRIGSGYARKLEENYMYTMGDVARCSAIDEGKLYRLFGVNAELLIDHAWGWEPCTMREIKTYRPESNSLSSSQVLKCPYEFEKGRIIVSEMADALAMDLLDKGLVTDQLVLTVGYDTESLKLPSRRLAYSGPVRVDRYGREMPKEARGTVRITPTSSAGIITGAAVGLYDRITDENLLVRRICIGANHVVSEESAAQEEPFEQMDLFTDYEALLRQRAEERERLRKERSRQEAMLSIRKKYGKNAILKGISYEEGATARERNGQIGGHRA